MKRNKPPATEQANPRTRRLDRMSTGQILAAMNREDALVAVAVRRELPNITKAVDATVTALEKGGRLFYVGAGTSGRLGVLDAAEIPPTFQFPARRVQALIAGGRRALRRSAEGAEDSEAAGARDLRKRGLKQGDVVVGLTASGTTPYVVGALAQAKKTGAFTIVITVCPGSPVTKKARVVICPKTGPEVVAGSTRLKAGTAQKLVLNMLSTAAMVRLGHVYRNLMVNVQMTNAKLRRRGVGILQEVCHCSPARARQLVRSSGGNLKVAIVMDRLGCQRREAERILRIHQGHVSRALGEE
jgi:N-acetylmuramic acid 6-phosphate etherase